MVQSLRTSCPRRQESYFKGPVKLIQQIKIAHSFPQFVSNLFHFMILSLPMYFYIWLSKNFSKPTPKNGEIGRFNLFD